jgi:putative phosphoesterase
MKRIGLLSDTHGYWDERYATHFEGCDEVWHAGDIGTPELAQRFEALGKTFRAVCGNIDGGELLRRYPQVLRFRCEEAEVLMKHIGGYPGHYDRSIRGQLFVNPPQLFVAGHSHILKVAYDKTLDCLHINPGAAGLQGWHKVRTLVRFTVDGRQFRDLEVIELAEKGKRGR